MAVTIKEVTTRKELRRFASFPNELYADNKFFVPQIVSMDMDTFDPKKNKAFEVCEGTYWLALDESGRTVGRIAGIINHKYNKKVGENICRFGWIDFIESQEVVHALIETVTEWGRGKGMDILEGPVGFLEFDVSGVLVDGFDKLPTAYGKYNAPYYEPMLLKESLERVTDYVEYRIAVPQDLGRYRRFAELVSERYGVREGTYSSKKELVRKYADGLFHVMNVCYSGLHGFSELSPAQCDDLKKQFLGNLSTDFISVIVDKDDKVVAFSVTMPSLSKALQKAKGSLFPFGWFHILRALRHNDVADALLIGVLPEYRDKGVNAIINLKLGETFHRKGIKWLESTRELEENQSVQNMWSRLERTLDKRARIYKKTIQH